MLPSIQSVISRRMLLNFRADPDVVQRLLPAPLQVDTQRGHAIVGICLIRMEGVRPRGVPESFGFSCENMAHRVAIRYESHGEMRPGVFIWRRDTDTKLIEMFGGRLFPGVHHLARFQVSEGENILAMDVRTGSQDADVQFSGDLSVEWQPTPSFGSFEEVSGFFRKGDCGFSCARRGNELEGLQLKLLKWQMQPVSVDLQHATFFADSGRFPAGSVEFDCGLLMRDIPHEWHEITERPDFAKAAVK